MIPGTLGSSSGTATVKVEDRPDRRDAVAVLVLVGLCLALYFFRLGGTPLLDQDEGMHATTSKEMIQTGDWVTPRFNGENFYDKPALFNWFVAACFVVLGFTEFAARLPAAVLGLGTVLVTYALGRKMFGRGAGLLAAAILCTAGEFVVLSRIVVHDISLTFAQTLTLASFYCALTAKGGTRKRWLLLFYASAALAVLAKGPIGLLVPALVIGLFLLLTRRWDLIRQTLLCPWGILIFAVIACPWYVAMSLEHEDYFRSFFLEKNLGSFLGTGKPAHPRPVYYYVGVLFGGFFPWSCFLPMALVHTIGPPGRKDRQALLFQLIWLGAIFVFFSAATSKLSSYILPLFPAAALLVAYLWRDLVTAPTADLRRGFLFSWLPLVGVPLGVLVYCLIVGLPPKVETEVGVTASQAVVVPALITAGVCVGFVLFLSRRDRAALWAVVGTVVCVVVLVAGVIMPSLDSIRANKEIARTLDDLLAPGERITMFPRIVGVGDTALFYTDRKADGVAVGDMGQRLDSDEVVYILLLREDLRWLERFEGRFHIVQEQGNKVIISNRAPEPPSTTGG
jgi:4-amino-4-deoxy-L-arabinose transferase-like glycosyltransferase